MTEKKVAGVQLSWDGETLRIEPYSFTGRNFQALKDFVDGCVPGRQHAEMRDPLLERSILEQFKRDIARG